MRCYVCQNATYKFLTKLGFTIYRCVSCGLAMTDLSEDYRDFVKRHYTGKYFTGDPGRSAYTNYEHDKPFIVRNLNKYFDKLSKWKSSGKLLDVGCALGFGVETALARGYDAYGFDPSSYATRRARSLVEARRIKTGMVADVSYKEGSLDVITLFDVFEHLADPKTDILKLRGFLKEEGVIMIATGDTESFLAKVLGRRWTFYVPPQHLFFFSQKTLSNFLLNLGFEPLEWFRIGKWLSVSYVLHLARTTGESKVAQLLYPLVSNSVIGNLPLYLPVRDNIVVIAKKTHDKQVA